MDQTKLESMGCSHETVQRALELYRRAKYRTRPGSGHEIGPFSTSLIPICALIASEELNNGEITQDVARAAACIDKAKFNKVLQIVYAALNSGSSPKKSVTFTELLDLYVHQPLLKTQLEKFCNQAEQEVKLLGHRVLDLKTANETKCTVFYWVCAAAKVKELPEAQEFSKAHPVPAKRIAEFAATLSKTLGPLRKKIIEDTKTSMARTPSPTKKAATGTPRRSGRQHREILTKESVKKRSTPAEAISAQLQDDDDSEMSFPETPTKKRKLESSPSKSVAKSLFTAPAVASSSQMILETELPQTPRKYGRVASKGSPLKQSFRPALEEEPDIVMEEPDMEEVSEDDEPPPRAFRRFRPAYLEQKRWSARDTRLKRLHRLGEQRKLEYFELHGNPFERAEV